MRQCLESSREVSGAGIRESTSPTRLASTAWRKLGRWKRKENRCLRRRHRFFVPLSSESAVGDVTESVDEDTGIVIRSRDTGGVELGASRLINQAKADDLVTNEISAASEGRGTGFGNLEPLCVRSAELVVRSRVDEAGVENSECIDVSKKGKREICSWTCFSATSWILLTRRVMVLERLRGREQV